MSQIRIGKDGYYSLTFINEENLSTEEIRSIFSEYGDVQDIHCPQSNAKRKFVRFSSSETALCALEGLKHRFPKLAPPAYDNPSLSGKIAGTGREERSYNRRPKDSSMLQQRVQRMNLSNDSLTTGPFQGTNKFVNGNAVDQPPPLIRLPLSTYILLIGNLPINWTKEDVLKLVNNVETPEEMSEINTTKQKLKYCTLIYYNLDKMLSVKESLDKKLINGRKLIVVEKNECIRKYIEYKHPIFSQGESFSDDFFKNKM